ncbi:MAG TPA: hypothetical protein VFT95_21080 [Micromonosporaceae bacterium]|nr:hypothetical protein [Micromonosporaceae bacterium]
MRMLTARVLVVAALAASALVVPSSPALAAGLTVTARHAVIGATADRLVLIGRYTCGPFPGGVPDRGVIDLEIRQRVNGVEVNAIGYLEPAVCDGQPHGYAADLVSYTGSFVRGTGRWSASGYVEGGGGMQHVHVPPAPIRIR